MTLTDEFDLMIAATKLTNTDYSDEWLLSLARVCLLVSPRQKIWHWVPDCWHEHRASLGTNCQTLNLI